MLKIMVLRKKQLAGIITHIAFYVGWPKAWAAFNLAKEIYKKINIQTIIIFGDKV